MILEFDDGWNYVAAGSQKLLRKNDTLKVSKTIQSPFFKNRKKNLSGFIEQIIKNKILSTFQVSTHLLSLSTKEMVGRPS